MIRVEKGFTLIELMIVVAIIGILASLAISMYQTYLIRAQIAEGISLAAAAKSAVIDTFNSTGEPPADRTEAGLSLLPTDTKGKYVASVDIAGGRIDIAFGNDAHQEISGDKLTFTPYASGSGSIIWRCGGAAAPGGGALPLSGVLVTTVYEAPTVEPRYLPNACRL